MVFFNVFFKTLGLLFALTIFFVLLSASLILIPNTDKNFKFIKGDINSENVIAILNLNGPIISNVRGFGFNNIINLINPNEVKKYLEELENFNPDVLIIKINSPGGTVSATSSLENNFKNFKESNDVKIFIYTDEVLASGGYWVATTADKIYASYGSVIGSIGVSGPSWYYFNKPTAITSGFFGQKVETENGVEVYSQNAGNSKDLYNPFRKPAKKELEHLQMMVTQIYEDFLNKVSKSRKIEINTLKNEIGALIFTSIQAKENFLVNDVLEYQQLIDQIIEENNYVSFKIIEKNLSTGFFENYTSLIKNNSKSQICNKLNSSFVSIFPIFLNNC